MQVQTEQASLEVHEYPAEGGPGHFTLVLLHFFGGSGRSWEPVAKTLATHGWTSYAPDLRGSGESHCAAEDAESYRVDAMADDVAAVVARLGLKHYVLVGHSMGGKVALALAARRPVGLAGVALLAPSPPSPEPMKSSERARLLAGYGSAASAQETLRKITARSLHADVFDAVVADHLRVSAPAWNAWLEHGSREDLSARMADIEVPVRIAVGAEDEAITAALVQKEIVARLKEPPDAVSVFGHTGHLLPLEAPDATTEFLTRMLTRYAVA